MVVLVVTRPGEGAGDDEIPIGGVSYARTADDGARRRDRVHDRGGPPGLGLAGKLLQLAAGIARQQGIVRFEADVLAGNAPMLGVFRHSGLAPVEHVEDDVVHVVMDLAPPAA